MTSTVDTFETAVRRVKIGSVLEDSADLLATEEPLEIRLHLPDEKKHRPVSITMRTPGDDQALAAGFLFTEGIIRRSADITDIRYCGLPLNGGKSKNTVVVRLSQSVNVDFGRLSRNFYTTSSCGVCGKSSIEALHTGAKPLEATEFFVRSDVIYALPAALRRSQEIFDQTGGLHASALFDAGGKLDIICEDVGRHNALDKVIGHKLLEGKLPLSDRVLMVSGRASFELVQKALMAGIPVLAAVGAPSSLAVELAREFGMSLIGFVRDNRFNIYAGAERLVAELAAVGKGK